MTSHFLSYQWWNFALYLFSREAQECVPPPFCSKQSPQLWLNITTQHMQHVQPLNPHQARAQFLGKILHHHNDTFTFHAFDFFSFFSFFLLNDWPRFSHLGLVSAFPMFGSSFFYIQSCSSASIQAPCVLAVNLNGLHFLNKDTHVCVSHTHTHTEWCAERYDCKIDSLAPSAGNYVFCFLFLFFFYFKLTVQFNTVGYYLPILWF